MNTQKFNLVGNVFRHIETAMRTELQPHDRKTLTRVENTVLLSHRIRFAIDAFV